ncbi:MAG: Fe2+-dependent dioxygenase [Gammaproteobacteria bacterium]|nr:Fe2+-dependent dioxygenase [Gammaproteobacteria bacterium]MDH5593389.1 Fe2+-dependent dioxygenase [Gammaproteobacteria bacterium]
MLVKIPSVLNESQLSRIQGILSNASFVDGKLSAGMAAQRVKNNEEIDVRSREVEMLNEIVMNSLVSHPLYKAAAMPLRVAAPYYARYQHGKYYGDHIDDPIMFAGSPYRSDVSTTVFLTDPADYEGGELVVRTTFGDTEVKLPAGHAVVYPSASIHHVNEVTKGERIVAVTWAQSMVRDPAKREILFDLYHAREKMLVEMAGKEETDQIDRSYVNLVRMWSEL